MNKRGKIQFDSIVTMKMCFKMNANVVIFRYDRAERNMSINIVVGEYCLALFCIGVLYIV